jgi:hypothetical protein
VRNEKNYNNKDVQSIGGEHSNDPFNFLSDAIAKAYELGA